MNALRPSLKVASFTMFIWAVMMFLVMVPFAHEDHRSMQGLFISGSVCIVLSVVLMMLGRGAVPRVGSKPMFYVTTINWGLLCLTGALPFYFGLHDMRFVDALFESVSGVTTTGSTIITGIEKIPPPLLLWRSLIQWVGGIGIILMAVAVLPFLKIGGMRLFQTESSEWSYHQNNRIGAVSRQIGLVYVFITIAAILTFWILGMSFFDAVNHAFTTVATGGYSTSDASFGQFNDKLSLVWAGSLYMFMGGIPYLLYVSSLKSKKPLVFKDSQVQLFFKVVAISTLSITLFRFWQHEDQLSFAVFTHTAFNVVSIVTTTGFATEDYTLWGSFPLVVFAFLMFSGACSGSTSGGIKLFRFQLLSLTMREGMFKSLHPSGLYPRRYNDRPVSEGVLSASLAYVFMVLISLMVFSVALSLTGLDPVTSLTSTITALMNVGPGFGDIIGPAGNFTTLGETAKLLLCLAMLMGRLEFLALLIFLSPRFWKW
ncbi:TrkH family potassium uptake protein [Reinekea sp. G2M2-21]|uniref:TrkH family potassium uptake protein n=1 Tax=Reinekea sp. G2M2-21 TaxID=2788942 RepID=UPI0018ABB678|nr:TrkH family potassium uptake protein [Reinekea sp. G2M2-21]